jgi:ubiquinone/menaquinone biosynthesis C-methylase UbiE/glycosyltransferase involved in cell wall biosynthesis
MRVCVVGYGLTPVSGHARGFFEVARLLAGNGFHFDIVTDRLNETSRTLLAKLWQGAGPGLKLWESGEPASFERLTGDAGFETMLREADLVHAFDLRAVFFVSAFRRTRGLKLKILYSVATFPKFDSESLFSGLSVVARIADPRNLNFLKGLIFPAVLLPWVYSRADHLITGCATLKEYLVQKGVPGHKIDVIYPPVNADIFVPAPAAGTKPGFRIVYYGWLSDIRGVSALLDAFTRFAPKHPDASLVFSSTETTSPEARILSRRIREAGRRFPVTVRGFESNVSQFLDEADLVVLPFQGRFGYLHPPMTLLEAIFKRRVFLTTPLGSVRELVHEQDLLVERGASLAERMDDVRSRYDHYQGLVNACAERVTELVALHGAAQRYADLYERLAVDRHRECSAAAYSRPEVAQTYDHVRFSTPGGRLFDRIEKAILLSSAPANRQSHILEVGSGTGRFVIALAKCGYDNITAVDASEPLLDVLREKVASEGLSQNVTAVKGDIYCLDFPSASFDFVYAIRVLNQLGNDENRASAIRELMRVTKPGGTLLVDIVNRRSLAALGRASDLMDIDRFADVVRASPDFRVQRYFHRLSFSQTLLEKTPAPVIFAVYAVDRLFSGLVPFFGTRVYAQIRRETSS